MWICIQRSGAKVGSQQTPSVANRWCPLRLSRLIATLVTPMEYAAEQRSPIRR
jgi:hypothetical protein